MIWFIIGFIVFIIYTIWSVRNGYDSFDYIIAPILFFVGSVLISFLITFGVSNIMSYSTEATATYEKTANIEITALKDNQNINSNFYLMGGYVEEDLYYYYAKETELGYTTEKVKASECYIKHTDEKPYIEKYEGDFAKDWYYIFGFPTYDNRYIIYVPEGTVTSEYNIDLE